MNTTWLESSWYRKSAIRFLLLPLSLVFCLLARVRRFLYRCGLMRVRWFPFPVIIVGNITVGGTGKTPLVIKLASILKEAGYTPGIVSRGYGGKAMQYPLRVTADTRAHESGDEALLLFRRCQCPVVVDPDRPRAVEELLQTNCDIVIADDGLQHYALGRDIEIIVIDGKREFGNGLCLPAGPLREPLARMRDADLLVRTGSSSHGHDWSMLIKPECYVNVFDETVTRDLSSFAGVKLHAAAGIGNPDRFYNTLESLGCDFEKHTFADHQDYLAEDLVFDAGLPVIMTEKDAVKYELAGSQLPEDAKSRYWFLRIGSVLEHEDGFRKTLRLLLEEK